VFFFRKKISRKNDFSNKSFKKNGKKVETENSGILQNGFLGVKNSGFFWRKFIIKF